MKTKSLLFSLALGLGLTAHSATLTVDNKPNNPAQYNTIAAAVTAASAGDTILIAGSSIAYTGVVTIYKELHLVGAGYKPNKSPNFPTTLNSTLTFRSTSSGSTTGNASGSSITGIESTSFLNLSGTGSDTLKNISISRCNLTSLRIGNGAFDVLIYNNIIGTVTYLNPSSQIFGNIQVLNNILGRSSGQINLLNSNFSGPVLVRNNLFLLTGNSTSGTSNDAIRGLRNGTVTNNVFFGIEPVISTTAVENCSFTFNLSFGGVNTNFQIAANNTQNNNITTLNPAFVSAANFSFDDTDDYNYPPSSPLSGGGSNNTDIGIYGGTYPWPEGGMSGSGFMYHQEPQYPQNNAMQINNISVPQNGTLNVTVRGIKND